MANLDEPMDFVRSENPQGIPESMCAACLHTLVAPTMQLLEILERSHTCKAKQLRKTSQTAARLFATWHSILH